MIPRRILACIALPLAAAALSGCVVAAIPLVAGGAIARTATDNKSGPSVEVDVEPAADPVTEPASMTAVSSETSLSGDSGTPQGANADVATNSFATVRQSPFLTGFIRYSTERAFAFTQQGDALETAVLREPSALDGDRLTCDPDDERPPAILIDIDPGDQTFGEGSALPASTAALSLKVLRAEGVTIAWISRNSAARADIVRDALIETGLDPEAEDTLLLMRYPDDRKQTRRAEFAAETCLIAIAGDERRDFDELYDFLNNRDAALDLERLINNGWFLIGERPQPAPARAAQLESEIPIEDEMSVPDFQEPPATQEEQDQ